MGRDDYQSQNRGSAGAGVDLEGFADLMKLLDELPKRVKSNVQRKVVRAGSTPLLQQFRRNARALVGKVTGNYRAGIARAIKTFKRTHDWMAIVGTKANIAPHAWWIEYGTQERTTGQPVRVRRGVMTRKSTGNPWRYTGAMPAFAPLRKAWDATLGTMKSIMAQTAEQALKVEVERLAKK